MDCKIYYDVIPEVEEDGCILLNGSPKCTKSISVVAYVDKNAVRLRQKYLDEFSGRDLHFFLGTMQQFHGFSPNPWVIIGVLPIPHENQMDLL